MALNFFKPLFVILVISSVCIPFFAWIIVCNMTSPWNVLVPAFTIVLVTVLKTMLIFFFPLNYEVPRAPSPWAKTLVDAIINFGPVAIQILSPRSLVYLLMSNLAMIYLMTFLLIVKSTEFGLLDLFIAVMPSFLQYFLEKRMIWLIIPTGILLGILICVRNNYEKFMLSVSTASNSVNFIVTKAKNLFDSVRANYLALIWKRKVKYEVDESHVTIRVNAEETAVNEMIPVDSVNDSYEESHLNMNTYLDDGDNDYTGDEHRLANRDETYDGTGRAGGGSDQHLVDGDEAYYGVGRASSDGVDERGLNGFEALAGGDCDGDETREELGVDGDRVCHGVSRARGRVVKQRVDSKEAYYGVSGASSSVVDEQGLNGFEALAGGDCDNDGTGEELGVDGDGVCHGVSRARGGVDKPSVDSKGA